jgi:uncharacterized membrane protein YdbT with pleckstrin-like domain
MMSYLGELLARDERVVRVAHDHWVTLLPTILIDAAVGVVIIGLSVLGIVLSPPWTWFGLLFLVVPIAHLVLRILVWWNRQYVITNRRIIQVTGMFNKRVSDTLLDKINDIVTEQSAMGRLLKYGDIEIISSSESGIDVFRRFADPIGFKIALLDQKASRGSQEGVQAQEEPAPSAGDVPALIAELDELRQKGLLTDEEFEEKKQRLLGRI